MGSQFFAVDLELKRITGPAADVTRFLKLSLASVTMDQPQYWPNEKVRLKILMPGRPHTPVHISWQKQGATSQEINDRKLDDSGVLVVELMDGAKQALE